MSHVQVVSHHPSLLLTGYMSLGKFHHSEPPSICCQTVMTTVPTFHCSIIIMVKKVYKSKVLGQSLTYNKPTINLVIYYYNYITIFLIDIEDNCVTITK